jgi:hypothetical protein
VEAVHSFSFNGRIVSHTNSKFIKIKERFMKPVLFDEYSGNYDVPRKNMFSLCYTNCLQDWPLAEFYT